MSQKKGLIIISDDEKAVRKLIKRMLIKNSLADENNILLFPDSNKAWEHISTLTESPRIVISSVDIDTTKRKDMNGFDLLTETKGKFPNVIFIIMSGTHSYNKEAEEKGANYFLAKPFNVNEFSSALEKCGL